MSTSKTNWNLWINRIRGWSRPSPKKPPRQESCIQEAPFSGQSNTKIRTGLCRHSLSSRVVNNLQFLTSGLETHLKKRGGRCNLQMFVVLSLIHYCCCQTICRNRKTFSRSYCSHKPWKCSPELRSSRTSASSQTNITEAWSSSTSGKKTLLYCTSETQSLFFEIDKYKFSIALGTTSNLLHPSSSTFERRRDQISYAHVFCLLIPSKTAGQPFLFAQCLNEMIETSHFG